MQQTSNPLVRFGDWEVRLARYLAENESRPFAYGDWDCALFVCGAIESMTGVDPAQWFRGRYHSRAEARGAMLEYCGTARIGAFFALMAASFAMSEVPVLMGRRGDMVLVEHDGRRSLGILAMDGMRCIIVGESVSGKAGLGFVTLNHAVRAWRV